MKNFIKVNEDACVHCGMCVDDCVIGCISLNDKKTPEYIAGGEEQCISCQHCMMVCPSGALSFNGINPQNLSKPTFIDSDEMLGMIKSRRSVRKFMQEDVPAELLGKIQEMLVFPPTGANCNNLHFTIVGSKNTMDQLRDVTYKAIPNVKSDSPLYFWKPMIESGKAAGKDVVYRSAPAMIACSISKSVVAPGCENVDPIIALSYFELYAQSLGIGTVWNDIATTVALNIPEVYSMLNIPKEYELKFILSFGIPAIKFQRVPFKKRHIINII